MRRRGQPSLDSTRHYDHLTNVYDHDPDEDFQKRAKHLEAKAQQRQSNSHQAGLIAQIIF
jgi:hypothetical protein